MRETREGKNGVEELSSNIREAGRSKHRFQCHVTSRRQSVSQFGPQTGNGALCDSQYVHRHEIYPVTRTRLTVIQRSAANIASPEGSRPCTAVVVILNLNSTVTGSTRCGARVILSFELFTHIKIITAEIFGIEIIKSMDMKDENRRCFPKESAISVANSVKPSSN